MGGYRSGRWGGHRKKTTVEASSVITADSLRPLLEGGLGSMGTLTLTREGEAFTLDQAGTGSAASEAGLTIRYTLGSGENAREVAYDFRMVKTVPHYGGARWYFLCPLVVNGRPCLHRASKLYLPPGGLYFGCRTCYGLTYTSSQESHQFDRLYKHLAAEMGRGVTARDVKNLMDTGKT